MKIPEPAHVASAREHIRAAIIAEGRELTQERVEHILEAIRAMPVNNP
jgi:hypothetical protein